jgi:hypothetical protein
MQETRRNLEGEWEGMEVFFLWTQILKEDSLQFLKVIAFMLSVSETCDTEGLS